MSYKNKRQRARAAKLAETGKDPLQVVAYHPNEQQRVLEATYESAARALCSLDGHNASEMMTIRKQGESVAYRVERWRTVVYDLIPFDRRLIALQATQTDRIRSMTEQNEADLAQQITPAPDAAEAPPAVEPAVPRAEELAGEIEHPAAASE